MDRTVAQVLSEMGVDQVPEEHAIHDAPMAPGDWVDQESGAIMCAICGKPKEERIAGGRLFYRIVHRHELMGMQLTGSIRHKRARCFADYPDYATCTFSSSEPSDAMGVCRDYVAEFSSLRKSGAGLMLYGNPGCGKTHIAACVCNELLERGWSCVMTSLLSMMDRRMGGGLDGCMKSLAGADLVVLDDFGGERSTDYGNETSFGIVDRLYASRIPMVVTTNLTKQQLRQPSLRLVRTVDRLKERCHRIEVTGPNRRQMRAVGR